MIITKSDLKAGKLSKEIIREIKLLADTLTRYNFSPIELKFKLVMLPDIKSETESYY